MTCRKALAAMVALAFVLVPALSFGAEGADVEIDSASLEVGPFVEGSAGTVSIDLKNTAASSVTVDAYVTYIDGDWTDTGDRIASVEGIVIPAGEKRTVEISFSIPDPGVHHLRIWFSPEGLFLESGGVHYNWTSVEVDVAPSIWSNPATYVLVVIVLIVVVVAIYLRLRGRHVTRSKGHFTAMDRERRQRERPGTEDYTGSDEGVSAGEDAAVQEYEGRPHRSRPKQQTSPKRKSDPSGRRSSRRR